ncbi:hypothetical protein [Alteromonas sp. 14N.309.X.WAT.G.H12]|uniref:hypothetical protein n=1 Tax=Alteromonas sp. 14N.309.X.WAT.G.H12 TaxID=3120824 RepID=UPI002FD77AD6
MLKNVTVSKAGKTAFSFSCEQCDVNSGEPQSSLGKAVWALYRKKGSGYHAVPPIIQENSYQVLDKRAAQTSGKEVALRWLAAVNFVDRAWKLQTKTGDFKQLSQDDQEYIKTITLVLGVVKRQAVERLAQLGVDVSLPENNAQLVGEMKSITEERRRYYPLYKSNLTKTMAFKVSKLLN